jgi:hypothetical protein
MGGCKKKLGISKVQFHQPIPKLYFLNLLESLALLQISSHTKRSFDLFT